MVPNPSQNTNAGGFVFLHPVTTRERMIDLVAEARIAPRDVACPANAYSLCSIP